MTGSALTVTKHFWDKKVLILLFFFFNSMFKYFCKIHISTENASFMAILTSRNLVMCLSRQISMAQVEP